MGKKIDWKSLTIGLLVVVVMVGAWAIFDNSPRVEDSVFEEVDQISEARQTIVDNIDKYTLCNYQGQIISCASFVQYMIDSTATSTVQ